MQSWDCIRVLRVLLRPIQADMGRHPAVHSGAPRFRNRQALVLAQVGYHRHEASLVDGIYAIVRGVYTCASLWFDAQTSAHPSPSVHDAKSSRSVSSGSMSCHSRQACRQNTAAHGGFMSCVGLR